MKPDILVEILYLLRLRRELSVSKHYSVAAKIIIARSLLEISSNIKSSGMSGSMKLMTDKHVDWNNGESDNTVRFGFSKSDRHATFGDGMVRVTTSSVSGSVKVYDFGKAE